MLSVSHYSRIGTNCFSDPDASSGEVRIIGIQCTENSCLLFQCNMEWRICDIKHVLVLTTSNTMTILDKQAV